MIETISLLPGVTLRCCRDSRFKQNCLSLQLIRPMSKQEAALNALIPAILLRGCKSAPDLRSITLKLDDLYGAAVGPLVRRIGDFQTTGFYCSFIDDRYTLEADFVLAPMIDFLRQLLLEPLTERGVFSKDFVAGEKTNLISTIESQKNDKRAYAAGQLLRKMCANDPFGIPRLGEAAQVRKITPKSAYAHYQKILKESPIHLLYVGSAEPEQVAALLKPVFESIDRDYVNLPEQTPFRGGEIGEFIETMDVAQGKLCMGFSTPATIRDTGFAAMQMLNTVLGGGMTSKLFMNIREKQSLCYDISSAYYGSKGIVTVSAGIDCDKKDFVVSQILQQLEDCRNGNISDAEMDAAREYLLSGLRSTTDSTGAIESFYANGAVSGLPLDLQQYADAVTAVTREAVAAAAAELTLRTTFFLKGVQ
jgi:predicted Zn-dependent peptidase